MARGYHMAARADRDSIRTRGLLPEHPQHGSAAQEVGNPAAVYVLVDDPREDELGMYELAPDDDLWAVDLTGLTLIPDESSLGWAVYTLDPVGPERLTLLS